jgi:hypothetical protein
MHSDGLVLSSGATELQKNTELVLYLLRLLEARRDEEERIWRGERALRTLQYTCHVLDALHELNLRGLTGHLSEPAANWLLSLPLELPHDDLRAFRLMPARFRVLARIGKFDAARLMQDFEALSDLFDADSGWIHDAPIDLHPTMATLLWADTLLHLESHGLLPVDLEAQREQALEAVETALSGWLERAQAALEAGTPLPANGGMRPGDIAQPGDASYAFDLLARAGRLPADSSRGEVARQVFSAALLQRQPGTLRDSDLLYCGLHLQTRFPQHSEARASVQALLAELRARYESEEIQREPITFHALVLRLCAAHHGEALRTALLEKLWKDNLAARQAHERREQEQLESEFVQLVRQSIRVQLTPPQRISGTRARGEVYRVRFGLTTESTDEHGSPLSTPRDTLRLIVKKGPPEVLARAIERYRNLPPELQGLFARHADVAEAHAPGYLIMQDLADMQPLSEVLAQLDRPVLLSQERQATAALVAGSVGRVLQGLHAFERRACLVAYQLDINYLAPMAQAIERLAHPMAFPELRGWLTSPLTINGQQHRPLDWYVHQLRRHEGQLHPPSLGYVHGDCHSRNLMLSRDLSGARLVDIETLTSDEDYAVDYGLLIEDVAVYQSLPFGSERGRVDWDDIVADSDGNVNRIDYPAFPHSEGVLAFQQALLDHLGRYAESIGDTGWRARVWLAIARGLMLLASRQLTSHTVEPRRRVRGPRYVNDVKLVKVAYAEAVRLLHELHEHLDTRRAGVPATPLPELPFPGIYRAAHSGGTANGLAASLIAALGDMAEQRGVPDMPHLTDYVTQPGQRLFARLNSQPDGLVLYLVGQPEQLQDPQNLALPLEPDDAAVAAPGLGSRVAIVDNASLTDILDLARQAQHLADGAG